MLLPGVCGSAAALPGRTVEGLAGRVGVECVERPAVAPAFGVELDAVRVDGWQHFRGGGSGRRHPLPPLQRRRSRDEGRPDGLRRDSVLDEKKQRDLHGRRTAVRERMAAGLAGMDHGLVAPVATWVL